MESIVVLLTERDPC